MSTQTYIGTLEAHHCAVCGVPYGITEEFSRRRQNDLEEFYCPNGHRLSYKESPKDRELRSVKGSLDFWKERSENLTRRLETAKRSAAASRGVVTKMKRRLGKGVCPCCNRYFADLHRHVQAKHPEFLVRDAKEGEHG